MSHDSITQNSSRLTSITKWKKTIAAFIVAYCLSYVLQVLFPIYGWPWQYESTLSRTRLVAVFVQDDVYDAVKSQIDRYTSSYLQQQDNTKAIIFPIDTQNLKSRDILKVIENMYFAWEKNTPSDLEWVVLIGDVPMPVINDNWFIFPSIYPYVDLEEQKYLRNKDTTFFVPNDKPDSKPELRHGVINLGDDMQDYARYFQKLKTYDANRDDFVAKQFWYDDFIYLKQTFATDLLQYYMNSFVFAEDRNYHRFTNTMLDFFTQESNDDVQNVMQDAINNAEDRIQSVRDQEAFYTSQENEGGDAEAIGWFWKRLQWILWERDDAYQEAQEIIDEEWWNMWIPQDGSAQAPATQSPTVFLKKALDEMFKNYNDLVWTNYLATMKDNILAWGRRQTYDTHVKKMIHQDSLFVKNSAQTNNPLLMQYNLLLERVVNQKVEQEQYALDIPLPLFYKTVKYEQKSDKIWICPACYPKLRCEKTEDDLYNVYYHGKKADTITWAWDLSLYRWTYVNTTWTQSMSDFPFATYRKNEFWHTNNAFDPLLSSVGATYGVFSTQVEANRAYNTQEWVNDVTLYEDEKRTNITNIQCQDYFTIIGIKIYCQKRESTYEWDEEENEETPEEFAFRTRWWASLINLDQATRRLKSFLPQNAIEPLYDIAGSVQTTKPQPDANTREASETYASAILETDRYGPRKYNKTLVFKDIKKLWRDQKWRAVAAEYENQYLKPYIDLLRPYMSWGWVFYERDGDTITFPYVVKTFLPYGYVDYFDAYESKGLADRSLIERREVYVDWTKVETRWWAPAIWLCVGKRKHKTMYSYKTIDSRVRNDAPTEEQVAGMNATTEHRPIDSIRNVTFKWIGWDTVQIDFPNLYEVQVFAYTSTGQNNNKVELLPVDRIEQNIREYLRQRVQDYNKQLLEQLQASVEYFGNHADAFNDLSTVNKQAVPRVWESFRSYKLLDQDFLIQQLQAQVQASHPEDPDPIKTIATILHTQNTPRQQKLVGQTVWADLSYIQSLGDINHKVAYVTQQYLREDALDDANPQSATSYSLPAYNADWYEAAYIASDGRDYITTTQTPAFIKKLTDWQERFARNVTLPSQYDETVDDTDADKVCNIPDDGAYLFILRKKQPWELTRFEAFSCWLEETINNPLEIEFSYKNAEWPVIPIFGTSMKEWFDELSQKQIFEPVAEFTGQFDFLPELRRYDDRILIRILQNRLERKQAQSNQLQIRISDAQKDWDTDKQQRLEDQKQPIDEEIATITRRIEAMWWSVQSQDAIDDDSLKILQDAVDNITFEVQWTWGVWMLDDVFGSEPTTSLRIQSTQWTWRVSLALSSTWDNCLLVNQTNTCQNSYKIDDFVVWNDLRFVSDWLSLQTKKAGFMDIELAICLQQDANMCLYTTTPIQITPWYVKRIAIRTPVQDLAPTVDIPLVVQAFDAYDNKITQSLQNFVVSASDGTIDASPIQEFSDFENAVFLYKAPEIEEDSREVTIRVAWDSFSPDAVQSQTILTIHKPKLTISTWDIQYTLPESLDAVKTTNDAWKSIFVTEWWFPSVVLKITTSAGVPLDVPVTLSTRWDLFEPWVVTEPTPWVPRFVATDTLLVSQTWSRVYLTNRMRAWADELIVRVPWLADVTIPVAFLPAQSKKYTLTTDHDAIDHEQTVPVNVSVTDVRGNIPLYPTTTRIWTIGSVDVVSSTTENQQITSEFIDSDVWTLWTEVSVRSRMPGWQAFVYAYNADLPLDQQQAAVLPLTIQQLSIPKEHLNVMYLSLLGTDRWNLRGYFSQNDNVVSDMINNSEKLLSVTTSLIDPVKIHKFSAIISQQWLITNIEWSAFGLWIDAGRVTMQHPTYQWGINAWKLSQYDVQVVVDASLLRPQMFNKNTLLYIPLPWDSFITQNEKVGNRLVVNGKTILDISNWRLDDRVRIQLSDEIISNKNLRNVTFEGKKVWQIVLHRQDSLLMDQNTVSDVQWTLRMTQTFGQWSTNAWVWIGLYNPEDVYQKQWFESVEDAIDPELYVWFRHGMQHITAFAWGDSVWQATQHFGSEFMINMWDPFVRRLDIPNAPIPVWNSWELLRFDRWLGDVTYSDPDEDILKTLYIDFNQDWLNDMLVVYRDWKVKRLKNYAWQDPFTNLWDLLYIAEDIKDVFVGDVDGNDFPDIIVHTQEDKLRVYTNTNAVVDVDGTPTCLQLPWAQEAWQVDEVKTAVQLFFEDMDLDWQIDIITNDIAWDIKIHYGWKARQWEWATYLSDLLVACDENRKQRQDNEMKLITTYAYYVRPDDKVVDDSLIRRQWLDIIDEEDEIQDFSSFQWDFEDTFPDEEYSALEVINLEPYLLTVNQMPWLWPIWASLARKTALKLGVTTIKYPIEHVDKLPKIVKKLIRPELMSRKPPVPDLQNMPMNDFMAKWQHDALRRRRDPQTDYMPLSDQDVIDLRDVRYHPLTHLSPTRDVLRAYKTYVDINWWTLVFWDMVRVTVSIESDTSLPITYANFHAGPRDAKTIDYDKEQPVWYNMWTLNTWAIMNVLHTKGDYNFIIDNIQPENGQAEFSYDLRYMWGSPIAHIEIEDTNNDTYPDIKVYPFDGCMWTYREFINTNNVRQWRDNRTYKKEEIRPQDAKDDYIEQSQTNYDDFLGDAMSWVQASMDQQTLDTIPWIGWLFEDFNLQSLFNNNMYLSQTFTTDELLDSALATFWTNADDVEQKLDAVLDWLCQWFTIGWKWGSCKWPPFPFNMSFLTPWNFQIFGCKIPPIIPWVIWNDNGFPVLAYPATLQSPVGPLPLPFPRGWIQKMTPVDTYGYFGFAAPGWVYPSMIRIYASPTLTMWMWFAMCFGPQKAMNAIPSPLRDIAWNCIVFAIPFDSSCGDDNDNSQDDDQEIDKNLYENKNLTCDQAPIRPWEVIQWIVDRFEDVTSSPVFMLWWETNEDVLYEFKKDFGLINAWDTIRPANPQPLPQNPLLDWWRYGPRGIGLVEFDMDPLPPEQFYVQDDLTSDSVALVPWFDVKTKIQWWMMAAKWLVQCIVNDRMDRQIKYIINNLTTMTIGVYFPDPASLFAWFDTLNIETFVQTMQNNSDVAQIQDRKLEWDGTFLWDLDANVRNNRIEKVNLDNFSHEAANPFDALSQMFESVPLVNITTQDVTIQIPFIYAEDITRYSAYLKARLDKNTLTFQQRSELLFGALNICNVSYDAYDETIVQQELAKTTDPTDTSAISEWYTTLQTKAIDSLQLKEYRVWILVATQDIQTILKKNTTDVLDETDKQSMESSLSEIDTAIQWIVAIIAKDPQLQKAMQKTVDELTKTIEDLNTHVQTYLRSEWENKAKRQQVRGQITKAEQDMLARTAEIKRIENSIAVSRDNEQKKALRAQKSELETTNDRVEQQKEQLQRQDQQIAQSIWEEDIQTDIQTLQELLDDTNKKATIAPWCLDLVFGWWFGAEIDAVFSKALKAGIKAWILANIDLTGLNALFDWLIQMQENSALLIQNVRANLKVLQQYKDFPLQLAEWIHISDRYLWEVASIIQDFMWDIARRMRENATRFSKFVDAIVLLIWIIRTRQAIIDVSVNRQKKCSTCTNDNYNFYGCGFGFICKFINIPILPIPPFKIPSIYIDLSHIDASIDIALPEFHFVPTTITLPDLPDLPQVPPILANFDINTQKDILLALIEQLAGILWAKIWAKIIWILEWIIEWAIEWVIGWNVDLGEILWELWDFLKSIDLANVPILPGPPQLPPLPSFIPSIELSLPDLPPPPKIPQLIPQVEVILDIADLVWKIYCIVKWWIWLVWEKWVKSKIEQLTQRTRPVPWFDNMDLTPASYFPWDRLQWFDFKIDSFVQFKFNFTAIYDMVAFFADYANEVTNAAIVQPTNEAIESFNEASRDVQDTFDSIEDTNLRLDANLRDSVLQHKDVAWVYGWLPKDIHAKIEQFYYGEYPYKWEISYEAWLSQLSFALQTLIDRDADQARAQKHKEILAFVHQDTQVQANYDALDTITTMATDLVEQKRTQNRELALRVSSYDSFLDSLDPTQQKQEILVKDNTIFDLVLDAPLFTATEELQETLATQEHPMKSYFDLQSTLVQWFADALVENQPASFGMDDTEYEAISEEIAYVQKSVNRMQSTLAWEQPTQDIVEIIETKWTYDLDHENATKKVYAPRYCAEEDETILEQSKLDVEQYSEQNASPDAVSYEPAAPRQLLAQNTQSTSTDWQSQSQTEEHFMKYMDISPYMEWIFVPNDDSMVKVVQSKRHSKAIGDNVDRWNINEPSWPAVDYATEDLLMRDKDTVYIKYANQDTATKDSSINEYLWDVYITTILSSLPADNASDVLRDKTRWRDGYVQVWNDTQIKIASQDFEVKNFETVWQSFDAITFARKNSLYQQDDVAWYLVRLTNRADVFDTQSKVYPFYDTFFKKETSPIKYILVLPQDLEWDTEWDLLWDPTTQKWRIEIPWAMNGLIDSYMTWTILKRESYLQESDAITLWLTNMDRKRYYAQVTSLKNQWTAEDPEYVQGASRSNQILAGRQLIADDEPPVPNVSLYRRTTEETVDEGLDLQWYINSYYEIHINREDNVWIEKNRVVATWDQRQRSWEQAGSGFIMPMSRVFSDEPLQREFIIWATDYEWNRTIETVTLDLEVPTIEIVDVQRINDWFWSVISEISQDMDEWSVQYQRNRRGVREVMKWTEATKQQSGFYLFPLDTLEIINTWQDFSMNNMIDLYDDDDRVLGSVQPQNWRIVLQDPTLDIRVSFARKIPIIEIRDTIGQQKVFDIQLQSQELIDISPKSSSTVLTPIDDAQAWVFDGWTCIGFANDMCAVFVWPQGMMYINEPYNNTLSATYSFDETSNATVYTIQNASEAIATVKFIPKNMTE